MLSKNERTAELVGLSFGDGGLTFRKNSDRLRFQLCGDFREDKEHYNNHAIPLFNEEIMVPLFGRKVGIIFSEKANFYGLSVESEKLKSLNENLEIPIGVKKELLIPSWIKENDAFMSAFIRGFLDTDGSVYCQRNYSIEKNKLHTQIKMNLACCSKSLIDEIYQYLKNIGFKCQIKSACREKFGWQNIYRITLDGGIQVNRWFNEIGSNNPKHCTKYQIWKEHGFCPPRTTLEQRKQILKKEISPYSFYS